MLRRLLNSPDCTSLIPALSSPAFRRASLQPTMHWSCDKRPDSPSRIVDGASRLAAYAFNATAAGVLLMCCWLLLDLFAPTTGVVWQVVWQVS
jgi:hypothetical protein